MNLSICGTNSDISQITKLFLERPCEKPKVLLINNQHVNIEITESVNEPPSTNNIIDAYIFAIDIKDLESIAKLTKIIKSFKKKNQKKFKHVFYNL